MQLETVQVGWHGVADLDPDLFGRIKYRMYRYVIGSGSLATYIN
jgi:hypothetical protein